VERAAVAVDVPRGIQVQYRSYRASLEGARPEPAWQHEVVQRWEVKQNNPLISTSFPRYFLGE
jgi:hypothetical protein